MKVVCVGGGPAGLYAAILLKKADPSHQITVLDRNPPGATYGWGVVFSDETLGFLQEADSPTCDAITRSFARWEAIDIHYRGETVRSGGHAFSGIARARLLSILQLRAGKLGVDLRFETEVAEVPDCDLLIAADGLNSRFRSAHPHVFKPSFDRHSTRYIWLGARLHLDAFTFLFEETQYGMFQVHAYPFDRELSTFIVECDESVWRRAGLDGADERESIAFCESVFAAHLSGTPLLSNRSAWINFTTLRNETWHCENMVLLGDAAHTAHFSVGSGTKMAMEDAIGLSAALQRFPRELGRALTEFELLRQPAVERTQQAARESSAWFESVRRYARFEPVQFAFSLLTRSRRVTYENLKLRDPAFSLEVDRSFATIAARASGFASPGFPPPPPAAAPLKLAGMHAPNRLMAAPHCRDSSVEGKPGDFHLVQLGGCALAGAGLVMTEPVAVSADGRISSRTSGLYHHDHIRAWQRIVSFVHASSSAVVVLQLSHAGRRGSTRPRTDGVDLPLPSGGWPLLAASALPYTKGGQPPREMDAEAMLRVQSDFVRAAQWAAQIGADMLELHCGHGYLLAGFLSPLTNRRSDDYGGPLENRIRYPLEVFDAVRAVWPEERPLSVCLSVSDWAPGGTTLDDAVAAACAFKAHQADLIHVVSGQTTAESNPVYGRVWQVRFSDLIRNEVGIPTVVGGQVSTADEANTMLAAGRSDICVLDGPSLSRVLSPA